MPNHPCRPLCSGLIFVIFVILADANRYGARLRTNIETDAAAGAAGSAVSDCVIALPVEDSALDKDTRRTRRYAEGASLT